MNLTNFLSEVSNLTDALNNKTYKVEGEKITPQVDALWVSTLIGTNVTPPPVPPMPFSFFYIVSLGLATLVAVSTIYIVLQRREIRRSIEKAGSL